MAPLRDVVFVNDVKLTEMIDFDEIIELPARASVVNARDIPYFEVGGGGTIQCQGSLWVRRKTSK